MKHKLNFKWSKPHHSIENHIQIGLAVSEINEHKRTDKRTKILKIIVLCSIVFVKNFLSSMYRQ